MATVESESSVDVSNEDPRNIAKESSYDETQENSASQRKQQKHGLPQLLDDIMEHIMKFCLDSTLCLFRVTSKNKKRIANNLLRKRTLEKLPLTFTGSSSSNPYQLTLSDLTSRDDWIDSTISEGFSFQEYSMIPLWENVPLVEEYREEAKQQLGDHSHYHRESVVGNVWTKISLSMQWREQPHHAGKKSKELFYHGIGDALRCPDRDVASRLRQAVWRVWITGEAPPCNSYWYARRTVSIEASNGTLGQTGKSEKLTSALIFTTGNLTLVLSHEESFAEMVA